MPLQLRIDLFQCNTLKFELLILWPNRKDSLSRMSRMLPTPFLHLVNPLSLFFRARHAHAISHLVLVYLLGDMIEAWDGSGRSIADLTDDV